MPKRKHPGSRFTMERSCLHCQNSAPHKVVHRHSTLRSHLDVAVGDYALGSVFVMIECPACSGVTLLREHWHTGIDDALPQHVDVLYPTLPAVTKGLPPRIQSAVEATERVKTVDPNAYGVLVRRGLELVCKDRGAQGRALHDRLKDLGAKNEIPERLVKIAVGLKNLGNIGAHADLGELSQREVPLMSALFDAILEHVYGAPHLVDVVEKKLMELKSSRSEKKPSNSRGAI